MSYLACNFTYLCLYYSATIVHGAVFKYLVIVPKRSVDDSSSSTLVCLISQNELSQSMLILIAIWLSSIWQFDNQLGYVHVF